MLRIIFGGTFDPIHWGHIRPALALADELNAQQIHLMPSAQPPHRDVPGATATQRLAMVTLAAQLDPRLRAEDWELQQQRLSYSTLTLAELAQRYPNEPLVFALGSDAFNGLASWHQWQHLVDHAHLVVMPRPNTSQPPAELQTFIQQHQVDDVEALHQAKHGKLYFSHTPLQDISATAIREQIANAESGWQGAVPETVAHYILTEQLYR